MTKHWGLIWWVCLVGIWGWNSAVQATDRDHVLILGKVSTTPRKHYRMLKPIVEYAARHLRDLGIEKGEVLLARDQWELGRMIRSGEVDWVTDSIFPAMLWVQMSNAEVFLKRWKTGAANYHTVFIARKDSSIESPGDLLGKTLALEDPGSTTAFFLPVIELLQRGYPLKRLASPKDPPERGKINYVFARSEINISMWVSKGLVLGGAYNNLDWEAKDQTPPTVKKELRIFYRTAPVPRMLELVRGGLGTVVKERLRRVLLNAHLDPTAKEALKSYQKTKRFESLSPHDREVIQMTQEMIGKYRDLWLYQ